MKGSALIRVESVTCQFVTSHPTDGMDEIATIEIFKPILIQVMSVGLTIEVMRRRILNTVLVTSIL